jgi:hypothetical protein
LAWVGRSEVEAEAEAEAMRETTTMAVGPAGKWAAGSEVVVEAAVSEQLPGLDAELI